MSDESKPVSVLPQSDCWNLLSSVTLGRLVTSVDGQPEIFPVNFVVQRRTVLFRTAEGTKLVSAAINHNVLFEADDHNVAEGWSVVVKGVAKILHDDDELAEAERGQLLPWTSTTKQHYVRIRPLTVTGRRFIFGPGLVH
ncbi:pyridoxamine 5'-phosphate oxidase family protein [Mycolicibacterium monacense]|uniref:Pyridoxamine 5'-phosphate oxidase n=4 Tax=Mycobacteriaceae TaxID=1762 RepID=A0AAD1IXA7_MYCMB|nr:pyridoxamine 5'-phosphate oxidase family protein [Mycolicibacterium monacense]MDA4101328.1 pyridoxamine 5'-phosphate oxidase [Mycolicibacterium monacense DSM 44395]OBB64989.1 pyridoxamine 5'-phosphate oxidase [Mycolicibacterium monacense]OBF56091.1 pyridoxamine 5'-phosphate oxidase [Mycolicibacterium monacense]ORB20789.1 pyridoxamine 5'-phosphate oxidase [Mycolicibacterium monacense DSM 44395]QHP84920.1 pyridoxamine 5'-phosphate oxidase family protein [Mycolicibacterium monacense DSM 44395]